MEILGCISYTILVFLTIIWILGIRLKLGLGLGVIIGSLFFSLSTLIIPIFHIPFIYSLLFIPLGFIISLVVANIFHKSQFLSKIFILFGSIYAGIIRIGINKNKIRHAQEKAAFEEVENWAQNKTKK
jgi:hypothetical protein